MYSFKVVFITFTSLLSLSSTCGFYLEDIFDISVFKNYVLGPNTSTGRNAVNEPTLQWPGAVIPYLIDESFDEEIRQNFVNAMINIEGVSCITFRPTRSWDRDYIYIFNNETDCSSPAGRRGGRQRIDLLNPNCTSEGFAVHALLHAVGFEHMHNDNSRDEFVEIIWENIQDGYDHEFVKNENTNNYQFPYDYNSIMHLPLNDRSRNGLDTMRPLRPYDGEIGLLREMTTMDIEKINLLYRCDAKSIYSASVKIIILGCVFFSQLYT